MSFAARQVRQWAAQTGVAMGLVSFIKEAGEKLFGGKDAKAAEPTPTAAAKPTPQDVAALSKTAGDAIATYVRSQGLKVDNLAIDFDASSGNVTVSGSVADQATREKVLLCCGNVQHVAAVNDKLTVLKTEAESQWHTVVSGDNLSKIAKKFYGDANKYSLIFEANKPMLSDPDKIYPGQVLRIPAAG
jgi:nucleoid-associated protein YgaU